MLPNPQPYFAKLVDPRRETRNKLHALQDIVMITLCAPLCGYDDWLGIEDFAHENEAWLHEFLPQANGILSHDTLSNVIGRLERKAFADAFARWMRDSLPSLDARHIALNGKTARLTAERQRRAPDERFRYRGQAGTGPARGARQGQRNHHPAGSDEAAGLARCGG